MCYKSLKYKNNTTYQIRRQKSTKEGSVHISSMNNLWIVYENGESRNNSKMALKLSW